MASSQAPTATPVHITVKITPARNRTRDVEEAYTVAFAVDAATTLRDVVRMADAQLGDLEGTPAGYLDPSRDRVENAIQGRLKYDETIGRLFPDGTPLCDRVLCVRPVDLSDNVSSKRTAPEGGEPARKRRRQKAAEPILSSQEAPDSAQRPPSAHSDSDDDDDEDDHALTQATPPTLQSILQRILDSPPKKGHNSKWTPERDAVLWWCSGLPHGKLISADDIGTIYLVGTHTGASVRNRRKDMRDDGVPFVSTAGLACPPLPVGVPNPVSAAGHSRPSKSHSKPRPAKARSSKAKASSSKLPIASQLNFQPVSSQASMSTSIFPTPTMGSSPPVVAPAQRAARPEGTPAHHDQERVRTRSVAQSFLDGRKRVDGRPQLGLRSPVSDSIPAVNDADSEVMVPSSVPREVLTKDALTALRPGKGEASTAPLGFKTSGKAPAVAVESPSAARPKENDRASTDGHDDLERLSTESDVEELPRHQHDIPVAACLPDDNGAHLHPAIHHLKIQEFVDSQSGPAIPPLFGLPLLPPGGPIDELFGDLPRDLVVNKDMPTDAELIADARRFVTMLQMDLVDIGPHTSFDDKVRETAQEMKITRHALMNSGTVNAATHAFGNAVTYSHAVCRGELPRGGQVVHVENECGPDVETSDEEEEEEDKEVVGQRGLAGRRVKAIEGKPVRVGGRIREEQEEEEEDEIKYEDSMADDEGDGDDINDEDFMAGEDVEEYVIDDDDDEYGSSSVIDELINSSDAVEAGTKDDGAAVARGEAAAAAAAAADDDDVDVDDQADTSLQFVGTSTRGSRWPRRRKVRRERLSLGSTRS
ncbi:hypothetical protein LTR08_007879 [Meristemomyces frigidus]|nr:hypothetical protein LTR08_007879 [Meristemomyces frigidus]